MAATHARHGGREALWRDVVDSEEEGNNDEGMRATKISVQDEEKEYSERALLDRDNDFTPSTPPSSSSFGALSPFDEEVERIGNGWFQYTVPPPSKYFFSSFS